MAMVAHYPPCHVCSSIATTVPFSLLNFAGFGVLYDFLVVSFNCILVEVVVTKDKWHDLASSNLV